MQKRLGELHDIDEALLRTRRARGLSASTRASVSRALRRARSDKSAAIHRDLVVERGRFQGEPPAPLAVPG
jgi:hypothetical protein